MSRLPRPLTLRGSILAFAGTAVATWVFAAPPPAITPAEPSPAAPTVVSAPQHPLTAEDVDAFLDGLIPAALNTAEVPGAVVVVVKGGQVLFQKGYGFADYAKHIPVDPDRTLFRPGSVSKLFTWTAVMQLVQAGKLDLDADVNGYLDFNIPAYHGKPVTLRDLMTHRGGFSETARDLLTYDKPPPPLDEVLKRYVPPRIFTPEEGPGYSNYGASVAGYIVQRVSGMPFETYVQEQIFTPLQMKSSTFVQPLPAALAPQMSKGYSTWDEEAPGFEVIDLPPAGSLSATGADMAHFMIAQLQQGRYGAQQILSPQTAKQMHETIWKAFPDLAGNALGFYQQNINGHRVIAHAGDTNFFHSELALYLDDDVGTFISVNGVGKDGQGEFIRDALFHGFADRYFPATPHPVATVAADVAKSHAAMIAGSYITTRGSKSTFVATVGLISPTQVTANADGTISTAPIGIKETFFETKPFLWQQVNGHDRLQATVVDGKVTRWSTDVAAPIEIFIRPGGLAATGMELPLAVGSLAILVLAALLWPVAAIVRWRYRQPQQLGPRTRAYRLTRICAVLGALAVALWAFVFQQVSNTSGLSMDLPLHLAQLLSTIAFVGGLAAALWNLWLVFTLPASGWFPRSLAVILALAFACMLYEALFYNLIGVGAQY